MRTIYIIANFTLPFKGKIDGRFLYLAEELAKQKDVFVELITSDFSHGTKKAKESPLQNYYNTKLTYCHEPGYIGHAGLRRLWSHRVWGKNVIKYVKQLPKPDCIYCAIPSLTAAVTLAHYCKQNKIQFVIDVQDLWPEATFMLIKNRILQKVTLPMTWYVNKAYKAADIVIAVSQTYVNRVMEVNQKAKETLNVFLGNNGEIFDEVLKNRQTHKKTDDYITLCYIGTLSYSYDIKCVIDALHIIDTAHLLTKDITFKVLGDGPLRKEFENYAESLGVHCNFFGRLQYEEMVQEMCNSDIVINPIVKGAAQSITNKVGDYALSGLPVISTQECQEYRDLIEEYKCGINCEVGNAQQVADAIVTLSKDEKLREHMGNASRKLGKERFDRRYTYQKIVNILLK